jgi:hypothetical protein
MLGFKSFHSAKITASGIESTRMIQKCQFVGTNDNLYAFEYFALLMA